MVKVKRALCFHVVVAAVSQAVVLADQHFCASAWELRCCELLFVVLLESWCKLGFDVVILEDRFDSFGNIGELRHVRNAVAESLVGVFTTYLAWWRALDEGAESLVC
jgi:hypothetical protein